MSQRQRAVVVNFVHDTFHQCRFTFTVLAYESHLVATFNRQVGVAEHDMIAVRLPDAFHRDGITARTGRRREFQLQCRSIFLVYFQQFQFFQHLDTALHLQSLRIRPLETFDEGFRLGDELLLLVISLLLLFAAFLAQLQVLGVVYFVVVDAAHRYFNGAGGDVVHEFAVVADHDDRFAVIDQKIFQPLDRFDVEVVGRLVKQEYVRFLQQQFGELDAHAPASAEVARLTLKIFACESKSE